LAEFSEGPWARSWTARDAPENAGFRENAGKRENAAFRENVAFRENAAFKENVAFRENVDLREKLEKPVRRARKGTSEHVGPAGRQGQG